MGVVYDSLGDSATPKKVGDVFRLKHTIVEVQFEVRQQKFKYCFMQFEYD